MFNGNEFAASATLVGGMRSTECHSSFCILILCTENKTYSSVVRVRFMYTVARCLRSANRGDRGPRVPPLNPPLYGSGDDYVGDDINVFAVPLKLVSRRRECQAV